MKGGLQPWHDASGLNSECEQGVRSCFAPAGRDSADELARKMAAVVQVPLLTETLNAMPHMVMVLNARRQIVAANDTLLSILNARPGQVAGMRPGEAVGCIRAVHGPDGCGTARQCVTCGAVDAILQSQEANQKVVRECRILVNTSNGNAAMDLRVTATPFHLEGDCLVVLAVEDISQSKRLEVLQRAFFHDVLNTAGCIQGYTRFLTQELPTESQVCQRLSSLAEQIVAEIQSQRDLLAAETGQYQLQPLPIQTGHLLEEIRLRYSRHAAAERRTIALGGIWDGEIVSDRQLVQRVIGNMVKNALEATSPGGIVTLGCVYADGAISFTVHNAEVMPDHVQMQIFQRSFSTKGEVGRGIGTYTMKLFGEIYLGGEVGFTSTPADGTTFHLRMPLCGPQATDPQ